MFVPKTPQTQPSLKFMISKRIPLSSSILYEINYSVHNKRKNAFSRMVDFFARTVMILKRKRTNLIYS
ncbi:hypothetical protein D932_03632 [Enterococcus casseliflavus 14-MB-W-14]|nr:hypothetical protein D932_03632 [Enterococcus casseliflavus 14-MB-W-14]